MGAESVCFAGRQASNDPHTAGAVKKKDDNHEGHEGHEDGNT
jgi:hypothetical protein